MITIANGEKLVCDAVCKKFSYKVQGQEFTTDLSVLTLGGCEIVLGADWLRQFSPVTFDFRELKITINKEGQRIMLHGKVEEGTIKMITGKAMNKLMSKSNEGMMGYLFLMENRDQNSEVDPEMMKLLQEYEVVFQEPKGMPPVRNQDHKIPLIAGSQPVNMRSYRIPYIQKAEVEKQVREMLESGIIQPSSSPYASPIILVKKKDGSGEFVLIIEGLISCL